jgi:rhodanese-related sulfurtransferase
MSEEPRVLSHDDVSDLLTRAEPARKWLYIDVRTAIEFAAGHIEGAYNVPFKHGSVAGLKDNPDFAATMTQCFSRSQPLILGCHSGGRAKAACSRLVALGYSTLAVHGDSLAGSRDHFGRLTPGWLALGRRISTVVEPGHSYDELTKAGR